MLSFVFNLIVETFFTLALLGIVLDAVYSLGPPAIGLGFFILFIVSQKIKKLEDRIKTLEEKNENNGELNQVAHSA